MKNFNTAKLFFIGQVTISIGVELELKKSTNSNPTLTLVKKVSNPQLTPTSSWSCPSLFFFNQNQVLQLVDAFYVDYQNVFVNFLFLVLIQFVNANHNHDHEN